MNGLKRRRNAYWLGLAFVLCLLPNHPRMAAEIPDLSDLIAYREGRYVLAARATALGDIVRAIDSRHDVVISGLDDRLDQLVSVTITGRSLEEVIKRLLRHLEVKNYAFEFIHERLHRVSVLPQGARQASGSAVPQAEEAPPAPLVKVVAILSIVEGSQAETLDLQPGDLVVSYDGIRIRSAQQLVNEVREQADRKAVDMMIVREDMPLSFSLDAGFIGIRIQETEIAQERYESFFPEG